MELKSEYYNLVTAQVYSFDDSNGDGEDEDAKEVDFDDERKESIVNNEDVADLIDDALQTRDTSVFQLLKLNAPEWPYLTLGILGSIVMGFSMPIFAILFGDIIGVNILI